MLLENEKEQHLDNSYLRNHNETHYAKISFKQIHFKYYEINIKMTYV